MARKKIIKQKQKQQVSQKVNVKVIVGDKSGKKPRRQYRRRAESQVETISSKTLAPVFIQPPVVSLQSNNADMPRSSVTLPSEVFVASQPIAQESKGKRLGGIPKTAEDLRPMAEPLKKSKADILRDTDFVEIDRSNVPEGYGMFYDNPLKDTELKNQEMDRASLSNIDYVPPSYVEDRRRDIMAYSSPLDTAQMVYDEETPVVKRKYTIRKPTAQQINDYQLYAFDDAVRNMSPEEAGKDMRDKMESEGLSAPEFFKKYADKKKKARQQYAMRTIKKSTQVVEAEPVFGMTSSEAVKFQ
jgi:hypothetical protein